MFGSLSENLTAALKQLTGRGVLTEADVRDGLREIRRVLLEADVSFELTRATLVFHMAIFPSRLPAPLRTYLVCAQQMERIVSL